MNENLNLAEILKDCPKGTKLYSPVYGEVEFQGVIDNTDFPIEVRTYGNFTTGIAIDSFTADGRLFQEFNGECMLFPNREERDWSKFKPKTPKFDPKNLQPFDKVLAKDGQNYRWRCTFYSHEREEECTFKYETTDSIHKYCIPYNEDTKHLVGTTEEAPEYYRY